MVLIMVTYSVWAQLPQPPQGWSRVAGGLSRSDAEWLAETLYIPARAMPDQDEGNV